MAASTKTSRHAAKRKPAARTQTALHERRRSSRIPSVTHGRVGINDVQVLDVSLDGVGFRTSTPLPLHSHHPILIGNGPMYLEGRIEVVSVRPRRDGTTDIGARFV